MKNDYYTYTYAYPDGTIFYVGKGRGNRINMHESEARNGGQSEKCDVIRQIWQQGGQIIKCKVHEELTSAAAEQQERFLIRQYGLENLTNRNTGSGRPVERSGHYKRITLEIREDLLAKIDASGKTRREYIESMIEK